MNLKFKIIISKIFFVFILLLLAVNLWSHFYKNQIIALTKNSYVYIKSGSNSNNIIRQLKNQEIINSAIQLKFYLYWTKTTRDIKAGDYYITTNLTHAQLIDNLIKGNQINYKIRFEEGKTINSAINEIYSHSKINNHKNIQYFLTSILKTPEGFPKDGVSFEGLLFPDTYEFTCNTSAENILKAANQKLITILTEEWNARAKNLPYKNPYQALIIASLIEKESGKEFEWQQISGVFIRRLQKKMRLQADPTVIYGLQEPFTGKITKKMLATKTAYNTYMIPGLPPSPISLVSRQAIYAALHPDSSNSLYFVAKGDGTHAFSNKLAEHSLAIKKYSTEKK